MIPLQHKVSLREKNYLPRAISSITLFILISGLLIALPPCYALDNNHSTVANNQVFSRTKPERLLNNTACSNKPIRKKTDQLPTALKVTLTAIGVTSIPAVTYSALYYYNSTRDKPILDPLFQKMALRRSGHFNSQYADIRSNYLFTTDDNNGVTMQLEAHIYDDAAITDGMTKAKIEKTIHDKIGLEKDNNSRYVILYFIGRTNDIRTYQDLERKNKSIMGEINRRTGLPVVTMNPPAVGLSKIYDNPAYSLDNHYTAYNAMIQKISQLYGIPPANVILYGHCIGGTVAARLASDYNSKLLILDSTPANYDAIHSTSWLEKLAVTPIKPFVIKKDDYDLPRSLDNHSGRVIIRHHPLDTIANYNGWTPYLGKDNITLYTENEVDRNRAPSTQKYNHCLEMTKIADIINTHLPELSDSQANCSTTDCKPVKNSRYYRRQGINR